MQVVKAKRILEEYHKSDYNASKALVQAGYKHTTATRKSKGIINEALKVAVQNDINQVVESSTMSPRNKILAMLNITEGDVFKEYLKIVNQDKDLTNKLKALQPLLATQGIKWNEEQTNISPTLNLTVKSNNVDNAVKDVTNVIETSDIASNEMAQQSGENDDVAQYALSDSEGTRDDGDVNYSGEEVGDDIKEKEGGGEGGGVDSLSDPVKEETSRPSIFSEKSTIDPSQLS